jgi:hypothetical protein
MEDEMAQDSALCWMMLLIGSIPVAVALARHVVWGVQATVGGILVFCALCGLVGVALQRRRGSRDRTPH